MLAVEQFFSLLCVCKMEFIHLSSNSVAFRAAGVLYASFIRIKSVCRSESVLVAEGILHKKAKQRPQLTLRLTWKCINYILMTQAEQTLQQQNNISNNISETIFTLSLSHNTRTKNG